MKPGNRPHATADALPVKPPSADLTTLLPQLSKLGLDFAADALPGLLTHAVKEDVGPPALISRLLQDELDRREERRVRTSLKLFGPAHRPDAGELRLRVPAGGATLEAGGSGHLRPGCGRNRDC